MTAPDAPLEQGLLDELVSADLDGELDRAATDLGLDVETARTVLATPAARARHATLQRARNLLATAPADDPARDDQLVRGALAAADARAVVDLHPRRSARVWRVVAGVAATAAVIAGVIAIAGHDTTSSSKSASFAQNGAAHGAAGTTPSPRELSRRAQASFGDVSQPDALRAAVRARLSTTAAKSATASGNDSAAPTRSAAFGSAAQSIPTTRARAATDAPRAAPKQASCIASIRRARHLGPPVLSAPGTADGRPVFVIVFAAPNGYDAYVVRASDCSIRTRTPLA